VRFVWITLPETTVRAYHESQPHTPRLTPLLLYWLNRKDVRVWFSSTPAGVLSAITGFRKQCAKGHTAEDSYIFGA
jgi:hypothetical protein